jgi:hypothetical protein
MKSHFFKNSVFFYKMPGQNNTKGIKKLLMAKKARIRTCPEEEDTGLAMPTAWVARSLSK